MKLFGNKQKKEAPETPDEVLDAFPVEPAPKSRLVLDIEGGPDPEVKLPDLKAETKALPDSEEVLLGELRTILDDGGDEASAGSASDEAVSIPELELQEEKAPADAAQPETDAQEDAEPESAAKPEPADREAPAGTEKPQLASVSYESMAEAAQSAKKDSTARFVPEAADDDSFLAELYALIGDGDRAAAPKQKPAPEPEAEPVRVRPSVTPRPTVELTPERLQAAPEDYEDLLEDDSTGVPGWLKGVFLLLLSLLLSAMTFYAVASDVLGEIF